MFDQRFSRWAVIAMAVVVAGISLASPVQAQEGKTTETAKSTYLVVSPHTAEECLAALDGIVARGKGALDNWYWGCMTGDHTGYEIVKAESEANALTVVPENMRDKARALKLNKFTEEQVASIHEKMK